MATFSIKNDDNFEYVKNITIESEQNINLQDPNFKIEIKDLFEHFYSDYFNDSFGFEECLKYDTEPTLIINSTNIGIYQNSSDTELVKNGIQIYPIASNKLLIRVAGAGLNNIEESDKPDYNTGYVGFCVPEFNITLNDTEDILYIKTFIFPIIQSDNPIPVEGTAPTPGTKTHFLPTDVTSRTGYDWNDNGLVINDLYVNNSSATSAYHYDCDKEPTYVSPVLTQEYEINSSAIVNDYLLSGETYDIFTSDNVQRDFDFEAHSGILNSYIYNEYDKSTENIPFIGNQETINNYTIVTDGTYVLSSDLHCFVVTQTIKTSSTDPIVRKNIVKLDFEV